MSITSLQVCMDSSDWLQGTISEDGPGMDTCSPIISPTGDEMLTCSRPILERRLRPNHEQALKCPRCESTHTKFCYYNNYSLSQPRYFCKTCRRYWTKGGTLRNIPVGGGCRRNNKKVSSKKSAAAADHHNNHSPTSSSPLIMLNQSNYDNNLNPNPNPNPNPTDLQLAFTEQLQFQSLHAGLYAHGVMLENPAPIDFMENKYEALLGEHDGYNYGGIMPNVASYGGVWSSSLENPGILESCQRLMLPYENHHRVDQNDGVIEMKPNNKVLSLEWHDCNSDAGKDSFGYNFGGLGSWTGLMNGYGSSTTNPLV